MSGHRMFVAVLPPDDVADHLEEFLEPRREHAPFRWTPREHLHVTLAFFPSVPDRALDDVVDGLGRAARRRSRFTAGVGGGLAFPDASQAKVLVAGLVLDDDAGRELGRLATGLRAEAAHAGVAVDGQRFRPHVTVARLGRPTEVTRWLRLLDAYRGPDWTVDRVALIASHLGEGPRRRPRYEVVDEFALGSTSPSTSSSTSASRS